MIVSHSWLAQFAPSAHAPDAIGEALSRHCVTLDALERLDAALAPFVVAQVVEAGRHPNSDHLWVTKVDDGSGALLEVVCGAPNVVAGHKYPFARTGTVMPGGLRIERRRIRGETSNGMLCSARELGLGDEHDGILTLETDVPPGTPLLAVLPATDARLTLDVLPNRPDLLSHRGVAREVAAILRAPLQARPADLTVPPQSPVDGWRQGPWAVAGTHAAVEVVAREECPHYLAVVIRGVRVGESPAWLRDRLESVGQRSRSNVVDATNYLVHGLGQPVHAFDLGTLAGARIVVRPTREGETITTLDGAARPLAAGTVAICDAERPVALAGIMGGEATEVTEATTDLLVEVARFDPRFVRRVRRAVGLSTDASYRYERGIDGGALAEMAGLVGDLIVQVAGGQVVEVLEVGAPPAPRAPVVLRSARLARVLGMAVPDAVVGQHLEALGCVATPDTDGWLVQPPSWRVDLHLEVDLIEEVGRLVGYDALPDDLRPFRPGRQADHPLHELGRAVRTVLVGEGLAEIRPMPFTAVGDATTPRVLNPLAEDEPYLRGDLLVTLAQRAEYNLARMQGNLRLFEIGQVFAPTGGRLPREELRVGALLMGMRRPPHFAEPTPPPFDRWDAKALAERVARVVWPGEPVALHQGAGETLWTVEHPTRGAVGRVVRLALDLPAWASEPLAVELTLGVISSEDVAPPGANAHGAATTASAPRRIQFTPLPVTPAAEFDLALVVPDGLPAARVEAVMRGAAGELLERAALFDEFRGGAIPAGHRSLAWRLTFRHPERTLREKEIEGRRARLVQVLHQELGISVRAS
jgi:phenylalanyl-tRNA synthetase beta chain